MQSLECIEEWLSSENMYLIATSMINPWLIGGDFNVALNAEEKKGFPIIPSYMKILRTVLLQVTSLKSLLRGVLSHGIEMIVSLKYYVGY